MIVPNILSIAGTDPSGGAGIQADLKSIAANGGYGMSVVTALVAQNTMGVRTSHIPPREFLRAQLDAVSDDVRIDAIKIGMLGEVDIVDEVASWLDGREGIPVILDPVMVSTSGHRLLDSAAESALRSLSERCTIVTPNLPELAILVDQSVASDWETALAQATEFSRSSRVVVLVKGGHLSGIKSPDALIDARGTTIRTTQVHGVRVPTPNTHGTGCSLSSALATRLGRGESVTSAVKNAKMWLTSAIRQSSELRVGGGNGPINHFVGSLGHQAPADRVVAETSRDRADAPGSITSTWWRQTEIVRDQTDELDFIRGLAAGTLDESEFRFYLAQDAIYLREFARVLRRAAELATRPDERRFWNDAAETCIDTELELHRSRLGSGLSPDAAPTTTAYCDHLMAAAETGSYARVTAAVLPCFWMYRDIGRRLQRFRREDHPYDDWIASYADPEFDRSTDRAIEITDRANRDDPSSFVAATSDFYRSAELEREFFAAPATVRQDSTSAAEPLLAPRPTGS